MPRKDFAAFTRLDASDVNTYLMDQSVQTFAGTAARGSAITTPVEGMMTYLNDLDRYDTYNGSSHVPAFGLTLVKSQTIGSAVTSVVVNDAFSADYDNYKIWVSGGTATTAVGVSLQLGASTTGYYFVRRNISFSTNAETLNTGNNTTSFGFIGAISSSFMHVNLELTSPFLAKHTGITGSSLPGTSAGVVQGIHQVATSYSGFTLTLTTGSITGGQVDVYGYKKA